MVVVDGGNIYRLLVGAQAGVAAGQGGTVVVGVGHPDGNCARGCLGRYV